MIKVAGRLPVRTLSCALILALGACDLDTTQSMQVGLELARQSRVEQGPKIWSLNYGYSDIELDRPSVHPVPPTSCQQYPIVGECLDFPTDITKSWDVIDLMHDELSWVHDR